MSALAEASATVLPAPLALAFEGVRCATAEGPGLLGVELALPRGQLAALTGARGAGKSLLLRLALGLVQPDAGRVRVLEHALPGPLGAARAYLAHSVGAVFEGGALLEDWSVEDNVGFVLREVQRRPRDEVRRGVRESLLLVGLKHVEHLAPSDLAAGARRRVALARAVAHRPQLLLLDEPTAALDPIEAAAVLELIVQLRERLGLTVLAATRDPGAALRLAERVAVLHAGRIAADGTPDAVRGTPDEAVQQLLAGRAHGPIAP